MHEVITLLNEVADGMPPARLPEDLWRRGRRRRRLRRLGALAAVAALMAGAAFGPARLLHRPTALTGGPSGTPIVPSLVHPPWLWQATVGQWPPGPAAVLFFTNRTRYLEETGVVIGRNGAYRLVPMTVGEERGLLSPDRPQQHVRPGPEPIDLVTGDTRQAGADEWKIRPLAWSPDGRWPLAGRSNGDGFTQYADGGRIVNQPNLQDDLLAVDASTGRSRIVARGRSDRYDRASWSPDGTAIAVTGPPSEADDHNQLMVLDAATGAPRWRVGLARDERLAGRQAWSPDGTRIAVFTGVNGQDDGSIRYRSATDGHLSDHRPGSRARPASCSAGSTMTRSSPPSVVATSRGSPSRSCAWTATRKPWSKGRPAPPAWTYPAISSPLARSAHPTRTPHLWPRHRGCTQPPSYR